MIASPGLIAAAPAAKPIDRLRPTQNPKPSKRTTKKTQSRIDPSTSDATRARVERLLALAIDYIDNEHFDEADELKRNIPQLVVDIETGHAAQSGLTTSMPAHLARLCETPLLSAEEEREVFRRMNYRKSRADSLRKGLKRSVSKMDAIEDCLTKAERLRNYLVQANTRLVMSIARGFADERNAFDDLLSQGIASLMHAVEKFDFGRGYRFSTYATCAVRRDLYRLVMGTKKDGQRYSTGTGELLSSCTDYRAEEAGITEGAWSSLSESIGEMMQQLDDREKLIIAARFGFGDERGKASYSKLGERLGISKERVRQIANRALDKLRELAPTYRLEGMLA